ncbi:hypothetical protein Leryth_012365 [Lithospermum erythrorhizon]|nr:hypothetical protein Leryth_012365 [Lithospermum erythrorhizon]
MSKITKWKLEKTKVKVVFRLQFHASHIPQSGWDKLFISFVPSDSGKATAKTTKSNVRNGTCKWADPIYETTRLLQDARSKQYDEKLYKLLVAMGSSRSSILGEAIINLADYADASKPSSVSLPLHGCSSGTILHVTVQLLTSKTGFREFEQQREQRERGLQSGGESKHDDTRKETAVDQLDKVNAKVRFRNVKELSSVEEGSGPHEEYADSALGMDDSSNTSESMYAEKHDSSSGHEIDSLKSTISGDLNGLLHGQRSQAEKGETSDYQVLAQGGSDSVHGWNSDYSVDNDLPMVYEENHRLRESLELAESTISELQVEINTLQSQANEIGSEMHKLEHLVASEVSSGEELAKDVSLFRSECSKFKDEVERLRNLKINSQVHMLNRDTSLADHRLQEFQLMAINGVTKVEDRIRELQNKTFLSFHERDLRFLHSQLDELLTVIQDIKGGTDGMLPIADVGPSGRLNPEDINENHLLRNDQLASATELDLDLSLPESLLHHLRIPPLVSSETDSVASVDAMKNKMFDMMREVDEAKFERENLIRKMHQMECYYEALIQELEDNQKRMLVELQNVRTEHSSCLYTISSNNAEAESVRQDMGQQLLQLSQERQDLDILNKELERRAATSDAALRRARLNYSIAVDKLQKDLELLSSQVVSMFEINENIIKQAFPESARIESAGYLSTCQNAEDAEAATLLQCQHQNTGIKKPPSGGDILLEDLKESLCSQQVLYQKVEEELSEMQFANLHLDIFSKTLEEILREADVDIGQMKEKSDDLAHCLDVSNIAKDQLTIRLQSAMENIQSLNDYKAGCVVKFKDMAMENKTLETNLENVKRENSLLVQKMSEFEGIITESKTYSRKYEASCAEKNELSNLLKQENTENARMQFELSILKEELETYKIKTSELASLKENRDNVVRENSFLAQKVSDLEGNQRKYDDCCAEKTELSGLWKQGNLENVTLQNEILVLKEELETSKARLGELASTKDNLQTKLSFVQDKLASIIVSYQQQYKGLNISNCNSDPDDFEGTITQLEEIQHAACGKILELMEEKKIFDGERVSQEVSLRTARSEILSMSQKFKSVNALDRKLQSNLESVANIFNATFEVEDKHAEQTKELLAVVGIFEAELQEITLKTGLLSEELEWSKSTIRDLEQERESLTVHLQGRVQESIKLKAEHDGMMCSLSDELHVERTTKENIESSVKKLTSQLEEAQEKLLECDQQLAEMRHFVRKCSDLEMENSRLNRLLLQHEESLEKLQEGSSCIPHLQTQLQEMDEYLIASDVKFTILRTHCQILQEEFAQQIKVSDECLKEFHKSHNQVDARLNDCLASEVRCREENAELMMTLKSLRSNLEDSAAKHNAYDDITAKLEEYQTKMVVLEAAYKELQKRHNAVEARLNDSLVSEACCREENADLTITLRSLRSDLESSVAEHDAYENITTKLEEHQKKMAALEVDYMELQERKNEVEARLHDSIGSEARCREENEELALTLKSLRSDLEASIVEHNACDGIRAKLEEYQMKMAVLESEYEDLQKRYNAVEARLKDSLASEACCRDGNAELSQTLKSLKSDLEASVAEHNAYNNIETKLEDFQKRLTEKEAAYVEGINQHALEVDQLKNSLAVSGEEIDFLMLSNNELETMMIVSKEKILEQGESIENSDKEIEMLQNRCRELTLKLSEQVLKTEEFKNLSLHFKELKDKVEADSSREKREPDGPPAVQESLRIAFIKEQYETRLQELRQQVSISRKHGEEMLFKLQDAIDEIENRRKSEALLSKRNEELSGKLMVLEADLKSALFDNCEKIKAYDELKTTLECAVLSLECCKEEKGKVEASLRECKEEKNKVAVELIRTKEQLAEVTSARTVQQEDNDGDSSLLKRPGVQETATNVIGTNGNVVSGRDTQHLGSPVDVSETHLKTMKLRSSMEHLHEELERMKNENSFLSNGEEINPDLHVLKGEIVQLHKVNEQLRNMFPLLDEIASSGNALERVLALEIELAESLRAKNKSNIHFQSSFLKQHTDEAAVLKSFRDINELIREMLELKGKYATLENELKEMHDRYSQLSLQFAEVEGDRQKLKMTLKNVRASRKLVPFNRSPTGTAMDHSP